MTTFVFDTARADTYRKEALVSGQSSDEPVLFLKPSWSRGSSYNKDRRLTEVQAQQFRDLATSMGFDGCQIMPGAFFTVTDGDGNVYGCEPAADNPNQPNAYEGALSEKSIDQAVLDLTQNNELTPLQARAVRKALVDVRQKFEVVEAYRLTEADGEVVIETKLDSQDGNTESVVVAKPGEWIVRNPSGEFYRITQKQFDKIGYYRVG